MTENTLTPTPMEPPRRLHFDWVIPALFKPRQTFPKIIGGMNTAWLTPMLILTAAVLLNVLVSGSIKQSATMGGPASLPENYQYYSADQQAQFQSASATASGPLTTIVLPAFGLTAGLWIGWLVFGGLMHLALTLLGGRGATGTTIGMVAWANLPFAARDIVRVLYMMATNSIIQSPGLSGFAPAGGIVSAFLGLVEGFLVWNILLLFIGVRTGYGLSRGKSWLSVIITVGAAILFQTLIAFAWAQVTGTMAGGGGGGGGGRGF